MDHFLILPQGFLPWLGVTRTPCKWDEKVGRNVNWSGACVNVLGHMHTCLWVHFDLFWKIMYSMGDSVYRLLWRWSKSLHNNVCITFITLHNSHDTNDCTRKQEGERPLFQHEAIFARSAVLSNVSALSTWRPKCFLSPRPPPAFTPVVFLFLSILLIT